MKKFPEIPAIPVSDEKPVNNPAGIDTDKLTELFDKSMPLLNESFAETAPHWIKQSFFDPECERERLEAHDYHENEKIRELRTMKNTRLLDSIEQKLRSKSDFEITINEALKTPLKEYLQEFVVLEPGDWPARFYARQTVYGSKSTLLSKALVSMFGPLHGQLNGREIIVQKFITFFRCGYKSIFGPNNYLSDKPKPGRVSLLLELIYGGWTLIRDSLNYVFQRACLQKDTEYITLLNLLDNYISLMLSWYSVIFRNNDFETYKDGMIRAAVMFTVLRRRPYKKSLLVWLSNYLYWKRTNHPVLATLAKVLGDVDEYIAENFHSILRAETKEADDGRTIQEKARAIDHQKEKQKNFR